MLRLVVMSRRAGAVAVGVLVVPLSWVGFHAARDEGAFGCGYEDRGHTATWRLSADGTSTLRVRKGEGVELAVPGAGALSDVVVAGNAGLAPGTQNGARGYVFRVTAAGQSSVTARTAGGKVVRGSLRSTC